MGLAAIALFAMGFIFSRGASFEENQAALAYEEAYDVVVAGTIIGKVSDRWVVDEAVEGLLAAESANLGVNVMSDKAVAVKPVRVRSGYPLLSSQVLMERLEPYISINARAAAIRVDGEDVVYLASREEAEGVLENLVTHFEELVAEGAYGAPGTGRLEEEVELLDISLNKAVEVVDVPVSPAYLADADQAMAILLRGTDRVETHTVVKGENTWTIASKYNMSEDDLLAANPQVTNPRLLQIGEELNLIVAEPYVTVESEELRHYKRNISFSTQYVYDDSIWPWETRVREAGSPGVAEVTEKVIRENGIVTERIVLEDRVIKEPEAQVVVRGSKAVPESASGQFAWPVAAGRISSVFGWRWGRIHRGIDIAAPTGTPVYAADSGYVIYTGTQRSYGRMIKIDHGGGRVVTLYAHLSSINVSTGTRVEKGQLIGRVGATGNATGSHLHFEVHLDGSAVNPMRFYPGS